MSRHYDFVCTLVWCHILGPHDHECCPDCGAAGYGNIYCLHCRAYQEEENPIMGKHMAAVQDAALKIYERAANVQNAIQN